MTDPARDHGASRPEFQYPRVTPLPALRSGDAWDVPTIRYAGSYRFADRCALDRALGAARAHIDEEDELAALEGGWLRCFIMQGTTLTVNIALPAVPEQRFVAAEIFAVLSRDALAGSVTASIDGIHVDEFIPGDDD